MELFAAKVTLQLVINKPAVKQAELTVIYKQLLGSASHITSYAIVVTKGLRLPIMLEIESCHADTTTIFIIAYHKP